MLKDQLIKILRLIAVGFFILGNNYLYANDSQLSYYFGHELLGNSKRYEKDYFKGFFRDGVRVIAANGPDYIDESTSEIIALSRIAVMSFWKRMPMRLYRGLIRFGALRKASMGQAVDQDVVLKAIKKAGCSTKDVIYIGHSKGGGLGANLLQKHQWKGAILIAPFCDANVAFRDFPPVSSFPHNVIVDNYAIPVLRWLLLPKYHSKGQQPLDFHENMANKCPVLIISIKGDGMVPQSHQATLYNVLKAYDWDVYYYEIEVGIHKSLASGSGYHHDKLIEVVQSFQEYVLQATPKSLLQSPASVL